MTATTLDPPTGLDPVEVRERGKSAPARPRRRRRWPRAVIPFVVLIIVWASVAVAHIRQETDLSDPGTLSPTGTADQGSSRLAGLLAEHDTRIVRVTSSEEAVRVAASEPSTIFVPAPDYLDPQFFARISTVRGARRLVIVQPGPRSIGLGALPVRTALVGHWITKVVAPKCTEKSIVDAGPAAVYDIPLQFDEDMGLGYQAFSCYRGGVIAVQTPANESVYVGATDPFRNDRIGEVGNEALAVALLTEYPRVIWLDVHQAEPLAEPELPSLELPDYRRGDQDRGGSGNPLIDAFPSWLWGGLLLLLVAVLLLAVARARRLGPPVAEPLPVVVPAAEAVTGRGRLYHRIHARGPTLDTLRTAAIARVAKALDPFGTPKLGSTAFEAQYGQGGASTEALVRQVAQRTGESETEVRRILYGGAPADDAQLAYAVADLDDLVAAVLAPPAPRPTAEASSPPFPPPSQPGPPVPFQGAKS